VLQSHLSPFTPNIDIKGEKRRQIGWRSSFLEGILVSSHSTYRTHGNQKPSVDNFDVVRRCFSSWFLGEHLRGAGTVARATGRGARCVVTLGTRC
jgi:hypothetical protein